MVWVLPLTWSSSCHEITPRNGHFNESSNSPLMKYTHRDVCSFTSAIAVSVHFKTDLVALMVGVDWRGEPLITISLVLLEVGHCKDRGTKRSRVHDGRCSLEQLLQLLHMLQFSFKSSIFSFQILVIVPEVFMFRF